MTQTNDALRTALKELTYRVRERFKNTGPTDLGNALARADAILASEGTPHTPTPGAFLPTPHDPDECTDCAKVRAERARKSSPAPATSSDKRDEQQPHNSEASKIDRILAILEKIEAKGGN